MIKVKTISLRKKEENTSRHFEGSFRSIRAINFAQVSFTKKPTPPIFYDEWPIFNLGLQKNLSPKSKKSAMISICKIHIYIDFLEYFWG